jgi:hypothetical protein
VGPAGICVLAASETGPYEAGVAGVCNQVQINRHMSQSGDVIDARASGNMLDPLSAGRLNAGVSWSSCECTVVPDHVCHVSVLKVRW